MEAGEPWWAVPTLPFIGGFLAGRRRNRQDREKGCRLPRVTLTGNVGEASRPLRRAMSGKRHRFRYD